MRFLLCDSEESSLPKSGPRHQGTEHWVWPNKCIPTPPPPQDQHCWHQAKSSSIGMWMLVGAPASAPVKWLQGYHAAFCGSRPQSPPTPSPLSSWVTLCSVTRQSTNRDLEKGHRQLWRGLLLPVHSGCNSPTGNNYFECASLLFFLGSRFSYLFCNPKKAKSNDGQLIMSC